MDEQYHVFDGIGEEPGGEDWLAPLGLDELIPESLAPWRPLAVEAVQRFLECLPPGRFAAIVAAQLESGAGASPGERLVALLAQCPTLHKLGQVIARHRTLDPALRAHLQTLETMPPTTPLAPLVERIRDELGADLPVTLADAALAEGSVAVVLPFTYVEQGVACDGVFKVLKPDVEARLAEELAILPELAGFLEHRGAELGLPPLDYRESFANIERLLTREIRLDVEQENLQRAAAFYADEPRVLVPRLLPWCTRHVTAMERVFGERVTDAALSLAARRRLARGMIETLLAKPFFSRGDAAVFHADLHAGNLIVTPDGRLAVFDWSLTATLTKPHREALVSVVLGALTLDALRIRRAIGELARVAPDDPILVDVVERALDRLVTRGGLPGFGWLLGMLDELALRRHTGFGQDFALFRKTWLSLSGAIRDLAGDVSPDLPLLGAGLRQFLIEFPARALAPFASADFATHASNADLVDLGFAPWVAWGRYWGRVQRGWLHGLRRTQPDGG